MVKVPIHFLAANAWKLHENYKDVTNIESRAAMRHFKTNQNIYSNNRDLLFGERIMFMIVCDMFEKYVLLLWIKTWNCSIEMHLYLLDICGIVRYILSPDWRTKSSLCWTIQTSSMYLKYFLEYQTTIPDMLMISSPLVAYRSYFDDIIMTAHHSLSVQQFFCLMFFLH